MNKTRKITIRITDEKWLALKHYAIDNRMTVQAVIENAIDQVLTAKVSG